MDYNTLDSACLNPCYSGICSVRTIKNVVTEEFDNCLNPCYSGICSVRRIIDLSKLMAIGLNPCYSGICSVSSDGQSFWLLHEES